MLVSFQYVFQYLLTQQRFEDAKNYISHLEHPLRKQHIVQNSLYYVISIYENISKRKEYVSVC